MKYYSSYTCKMKIFVVICRKFLFLLIERFLPNAKKPLKNKGKNLLPLTKIYHFWSWIFDFSQIFEIMCHFRPLILEQKHDF